MKTASLMMGLLVFLLAGCTNTADEREHEAADLAPLAYTIYSNKTELFVEFKPLVVGSRSNFAAHFTILGENFLPLTEGKITVSLIVGENGIRNSADTASAPGIFRLALSPTTAGVGKLVFDIETNGYTDQIVIEGIAVYADAQTALAQQEEKAGGDEISYLKEQAWKVEFANAPATKQPFSAILKTHGQILSAPGDETVLTAQISGILSFSSNNMILGSAIGAGTALFSIKSNEVVQSNLGAAVQQATNDLAVAKQQLERATALAKDKIISEKELLEAKLRFENAQSQLSNLSVSKDFNQNRQSVSSPIGGFLKSLLVENGQFVQAGQPLAYISKNRKLVLQANVSQRHFGVLPTIVAANFKPVGSETVFDTQALNGRVISFGKSATANAPFIPITFEVDNIGNLIPGTAAEVYLKSAAMPNALLVPVGALMEEQGNFYVYVQSSGEGFQKREVKLGASDGIQVQLLSGVSEGERVVVKGAYQIKLSAASGKLPAHGHEH